MRKKKANNQGRACRSVYRSIAQCFPEDLRLKGEVYYLGLAVPFLIGIVDNFYHTKYITVLQFYENAGIDSIFVFYMFDGTAW